MDNAERAREEGLDLPMPGTVGSEDCPHAECCNGCTSRADVAVLVREAEARGREAVAGDVRAAIVRMGGYPANGPAHYVVKIVLDALKRGEHGKAVR